MKKFIIFLFIISNSPLLAQFYCYEDKDGDTFGDPATLIPAPFGGCVGLVSNGLDCNDNDATINPNTKWYKDLDNDGYTTDSDNPLIQCTQPAGYNRTIQPGIDCDDNDLTVWGVAQLWIYDPDGDHYVVPLAQDSMSICKPDGYTRWLDMFIHFHEDDCNPYDSLEHPNQQWYPDIDGDRYRASTTPLVQCTRPSGHKAASELYSLDIDCNDNDAVITIFGIVWYRDLDNDGYSDSATLIQCTQPTGYKSSVSPGIDCNDNDPIEHPNQLWFLDSDGDGHGKIFSSVGQCIRPTGRFAFSELLSSGDCNDNNSSIYPGAIEICDNADNNCNGETDEGVTSLFIRDADGDGAGNPAVFVYACTAPAGYIPFTIGFAGDCDDNNPAIISPKTYYKDADNDGYGEMVGLIFSICSVTAPSGYSANNTDCNDSAPGIHPGATEVCDGVDNDCDGLIDEGVKLIFNRDLDGDGYGNATVSVQACSVLAGYVANSTDCNDTDPTVNPGAVEVCNNNKDDNCNGSQNEAGCYTCGNATSFSTTNVTSNSATLNWVSIPHPNYWQVQYKSTSPGTKWIDVAPDPAGNQRSVTINGLTPNKNYLWHIKAKCGNGWTSYSVSIPFTTAGGPTTRSQTSTNAEMEASEVVIGSLQIKASPNPSTTSFRITLNSNNLKEPVKLIITDMLGRVIETRITNAGQIIIGEKYRSGTYLVNIIQGKESRQLKLIKLPD